MNSRVKHSKGAATNYQTPPMFDTFSLVMKHVENSPNALGFILVGQGLISRGDLYLGLRHHRRTQAPLGRSLIELGLLDEEGLANALAFQAHCPRLPSGQLAQLVHGTKDERTTDWDAFGVATQSIVFGSYESTLYVAITDARAIGALEQASVMPDYAIGAYVVSESDFDTACRILSGEPADVSETSPADVPQVEPEETGPSGYRMLEIGFYEASEALFEAPDLESLGAVAASALKHFFPLTASILWDEGSFRLLARSTPGELPVLQDDTAPEAGEPYYGGLSECPLSMAVLEWLGVSESPAISVAYWTVGANTLVLVGGHGPGDDTYGDLNDVSGLFQEVETALNVLNIPSTNG